MTNTTLKPTPETTPVPGGGSWHWDYAQACWVENQPADAIAPQPIETTPQE